MAIPRIVSAFLLAGLLNLSTATLAFAADEHAPAAEGKPTIIPTPRQAIAPAVTTLIVFSLLVAILAKYAWGPIASGLKAREDKIRKDIDDAEAARARAESTLKEYEVRLATAEQQVRDMLAKATTQGEQIAENIRTRAQQDAEESKAKALRDIEASRKQAVDDIYDQAAMLATEVAKRVLPRSLTDQDQQALLDRSVEQVQSLRQSAVAV
jgi:F-type H+-transporting ATPase subunit b